MLRFIRRLFGAKRDDPVMVKITSTTKRDYSTSESFERPFEYVQAGLNAHEKGNLSDAERLLIRGIQEYKASSDPSGHWYALGRYGFFLSQVGRNSEAVNVLEEAISRGSDIPGSYEDLMQIYGDRGSEADLFRIADIYAARIPKKVENIVYSLMGLAFKLETSKETERWLLRTEGWAQQHDLLHLKYMVWGNRGHLAEKNGGLQKAEATYRKAIDAGSRDRKTYTRLLMILEKKSLEEASALAQFALGIQSDAAWEEDLRKRLARFESKLSPHVKQKTEIPGFSVREGANRVELIEQVHITYGARHLALSADKDVIVISKGSSKPDNLVARHLASAAETWSRSIPQSSAPVYSLPTGGYLVIVQTGTVGSGKCDIIWLDSLGQTTHTAEIPDKYTEVAISDVGVAVGCRDGNLYSFDHSARLIFKHRVSQDIDIPFPSPYSLPCPYFLDTSKNGRGICYSSWDTVTYVDHHGKRKWTWTAEQNTKSYTLTVPLHETVAPSECYRILGISSSATGQDIQKAFRKRSKETHPDLHPDNPNAAAEFRQVVGAFEAISAGVSPTNSQLGGITVSITGPSPTVYDVVMSSDGKTMVTATSDGSISVLNRDGRVLQRFVAAAGAGTLAATKDLSLIVYSHWEGINFYNHTGLVNTFNLEELTDLDMSPSGELIAATRKKDLHLFDISGRRIAHIEFARNITDLVFRDDAEIIVASGKLIRLRVISSA